MVWLEIAPQNGATIVTRMTNVAILKYLQMAALILSHCRLHPFIIPAICQQLMDSPWSLCVEGTEEPHLDPGCYPAMYDQVVPESIPMQRKSDKRQNNLRNRPRLQDGRLVIFRFVKPAQMLLWLAPRKCKLLCTNKVLTTFNILQHSSTTSLTVSNLHVSPCISV